LKESTFRVGNMGWIPEGYIDEMLGALAQVVA
jgi:aspartate aminotransferase-like enzyme